jgi:hypothetical protein
MSETIDFATAAFVKTEVGQQEIQKRGLGLAPLVRRLLVLVDGQRTGDDLAMFAGDADVEPLLQELLDKGCVEARARPRPAASEVPSQAHAPAASLGGLAEASTRTTAENDMARNFMINTVNTVFGQHARLSLIETIAAAKTTDELRLAYLSWVGAMEENRAGAKRLPDLQQKLFKVL